MPCPFDTIPCDDHALVSRTGASARHARGIHNRGFPSENRSRFEPSLARNRKGRNRFCLTSATADCLPDEPRRFPAWGRLVLAAVLAMAITAGCFHAPVPYLPAQWPGATEPIDTLSDGVARPVLQVLIAYNVYWPNHTALRLVDAAGRVIFWDPGGGYGKEAAEIVRHSDLIIDRAPNLATYMVYRWSNNDQAVEIFEWVLSAAEAQRLADALRAGAARRAGRDSGFRTATPGLFCNAAVSSFLYDYGEPSLRVSDSYILPNLLSRELYTRRPDRVMILKRDNRAAVRVIRPPDRPPNLVGLHQPGLPQHIAPRGHHQTHGLTRTEPIRLP